MTEKIRPMRTKGAKFEKMPGPSRATPRVQPRPIQSVSEKFSGVGIKEAANRKVHGSLPKKNDKK